MCQFLHIGKFEIIVHYMEVTLDNDHQFAPSLISLTSNLYWGQRLTYGHPRFWSKMRSIAKWPLSRLRIKNTIVIWYLNDNELTLEIWGQNGLKQPQIYKFEFGWAQAKSDLFQFIRSIDFIGGPSFKKRTNYESLQNLRSYDILQVHLASI